MTLEGAVEARNDRGIKLDGEWRNVSKFRPVAIPEVGAHVRAEIDDKGFLKSIDVLEHTGAGETPAVSRDERITRLAVLKAAANFLGLLSQTREEVRSEHVLTLADKWLAWVDNS